MVDLPTTDPRWIDQRTLEGKELTTEEQRISEQQFQILRSTIDILNQPVVAGDMKAARERAEALKTQFESLIPEMKEFLYGTLQTKMGKNDLAWLFHHKLSSSTRDIVENIESGSSTGLRRAATSLKLPRKTPEPQRLIRRLSKKVWKGKHSKIGCGIS